MTITLNETTPGYISVWRRDGEPRFCGYVEKGGRHRAYALVDGCQIIGDFSEVRAAIRAVAATA
jgi:hypothetical protein